MKQGGHVTPAYGLVRNLKIEGDRGSKQIVNSLDW